MIFNIKLTGVEEALKMFDPRKVQKAAQFCLNRAVKSGRAEMSDQIRKGERPFKLKKSDVDKKITIKGVTLSNLQAVITVTGEPIILSYFNPIELRGGVKTFIAKNKNVGFGLAQKKARGDTGGVQVEILSGRKVVIKKAFIARGKGGTPLVFIRRDKRNSKGKQLLFSPKVYTLPSMVKKSYVLNVVSKKIETQWQKEWDNQLNQLKTSGSWLENN